MPGCLTLWQEGGSPCAHPARAYNPTSPQTGKEIKSNKFRENRVIVVIISGLQLDGPVHLQGLYMMVMAMNATQTQCCQGIVGRSMERHQLVASKMAGHCVGMTLCTHMVPDDSFGSWSMLYGIGIVIVNEINCFSVQLVNSRWGGTQYWVCLVCHDRFLHAIFV